MRFICTIFLLLFAVPLLAAEPSADLEIDGTEQSPNKDITVTYGRTKKQEVAQVWLSSGVKNKKQSFLLYESDRSVEVLFSPDENWIALNDFAGSDITEVHLFKRKKGAEYDEVISADVTGKAWDFFSKLYSLPNDSILGHRYVQCIRWAADSSAFLMVLSGHEDEEHYLDEWLCTYDVRTLQPTLKLSDMNRGSVYIKGSKPLK